MARNYDEQRRVTHDYRNHLQTLAGLLQQGEHSQAQAYLKKLIGQSPQAAYVLDTQNPVFDSLLNQKYQQACGQNIGMEFNLEGINELPFSNEDLVTLFSNLLDNAIEACEKVKGRRVVIVTLRCTGTETLLTVRNTSPRWTPPCLSFLPPKKMPQHMAMAEKCMRCFGKIQLGICLSLQ